MPSTRAVLADITDLGLHPADHHRVVGMNGRLRGAMVAAEAVVEKVETVIKAGLVKLEEKAAEVVEEAKTEIVQLETATEETPSVESETTDATPEESEKKTKRGKKSSQ